MYNQSCETPNFNKTVITREHKIVSNRPRPNLKVIKFSVLALHYDTFVNSWGL